MFVVLLGIQNACMNDDALRDFNLLNKNVQGVGVFIVNEGNFMYGNASLSYYKPKTGQTLNNIFYNANALPLGDVAFSMSINDSLGYIVVNNSGKIYIINIRTFRYVAKITGFTSPRYILFVNKQKAYVSDLYAKAISIVNLKTNKITGSISLNNHNPDFYQHPSEQMIKFHERVFVNAWSYDNKVLIINSLTDRLVDSVEVTKQPNSMVIDKYNKLWVLSDGGTIGSPYGQEMAALTKIDAKSLKTEAVFLFKDMAASPSNLCINNGGDSLFFLYNDWSGSAIANAGVYVMSIESKSLPVNSLIPQDEKLFYALGIDPVNSSLYVSDAIDFVRSGKVYIFRPNGLPVDTLTTGIIPGDFCFKKKGE